MPSSDSFNLNVGERESLRGLTSEKTGCQTRKIIIIGIIVAVAILALGLGLGLGLRKKSEPEPTTCTTFNKDQFRARLAEGTHGATWLKTDCTLSEKPQCPSGFENPPLLIVSMDGFRYDYLKRNLTPVMEKIANCGVKTEYMRPTFPSKTFPNHYSIVTGLYPESHGIIDNVMVDLEMNQLFTLAGNEKSDPRWWHGEPIWVSARKAGKRSATMFWPGSEVKINGYYPNRCYWFDKSLPFEMRVDRVLSWLDEPAGSRPDVINLYFDQPDSAGHKQGPDGDLVNANVTALDNLMGDLMDELIKRKLHTCIDIIITSDHGMAPISRSKVVDIREPIREMKAFAFDGIMGRVTSKYTLKPTLPPTIERVENGASADEMVEKLECVDYNSTSDYNSKVFKKGDLPVRVHYAVSPRIEEVVITASDEWQIRGEFRSGSNGGAHGYDNTYMSMQPIFMAFGSSFKQQHTVQPFENIELYNLMTDILQINPAPNNGTNGRLHQMLRHPPSSPTAAPPASEYLPVKFPDDAAERGKRRAASDCNCTDGITDVDGADLRLKLTPEKQTASVNRHLGEKNRPVLGQEGLQVWSLVQEDYLTAYSKDHRMPLWAAFALDEQTDLVNMTAVCSRVDVRMTSDNLPKCAEYSDSTGGIGPAYLMPPGIMKSPNQADMQISTNIVPMYTSFREGIWKTMMEVITDYQSKYKKVNVLVGPVFDDNHDGLVDTPKSLKLVPGSNVPLPTHFFVMLTSCSDRSVDVTKCADDKLQIMSVILPHLNKTGNCWDAGDSKPFEYLQNNVARPRDVELITGLTLLQGVAEADQQLELRTNLEVGLWARTSWLDEEQCPQFDTSTCPMGADDIPVLLISIDGFRPDYLDLGVSPVLEKLGNCGVRTPYLQSAYPSLTFPNHYSLVTGLHPESHGIVENNMFDLKINRTFSLGSKNTFIPDWWGGEPLWNTVERNNKKAGVFFWPGSDVEIGGMRPSEYFVYDGNVPYSKRVDKVLDWLSGKRGLQTQLAILYMDKVDKAGHTYGPLTDGVKDAIRYVDGYLKRLMDGLRRAKLDRCVNIIVTSDHGMTDISCDRSIEIADYVPRDELAKTYVYTGGAGRMATTYNRCSSRSGFCQPVPEAERVSVDMVVQNTSCVSDHMHVFSLPSLPKRFHYTNNARIGEVLFVMDDEWMLNRYRPWCGIKGQHGWDPMSHDSMMALFQSFGPDFKRNYTSPPFENIEIYNLITNLMSINGAPNNGTKGSLHHLLFKELPAPAPGGLENYTVAEYPTTDEVYNNRTTSAGCSCSIPDGKTLKEYDERLRLDLTRREQLSERHLPSGRPTVDGQVALQSLWQEDYISAYSPTLGLPLWTAYIVTNQSAQNVYVQCNRPDVRLDVTDQPSCEDFRTSRDYIDNFLFPPVFASSNESAYDAYLLTNSVPMMPNFASGVWRHIVSLTQKWAQSAGPIHVISGPVFDYNSDGIADDINNITETVGDKGNVPIPSHYFVVMLRCPVDNPSSCSDMSYETQAFVLEHRANVTNCMSFDAYVWDHRARLRDVELLTGLELLTAAQTLPAVQTRTFLPRSFGFSEGQ